MANRDDEGRDERIPRAVYDWIVENTVRDADVKGCGLGDVRGMLEMKNRSGKCLGGERRDSLDPEHFGYTMTAREV